MSTRGPEVVGVLGLGYVGLPLAQAALTSGDRVVGFDIDVERVARLRRGVSHVDDLSDPDLALMLSSGFEPTADESRLDEATAKVICVPTPLSADGRPDLTPLVAAAETVSRHLRRGDLVVLESTTYPGTTEEVVRPILERSGLQVGHDLALAFSPERVDPGNREFGIRNTPKVVGGVTRKCTDRATTFYEGFVDCVVPAVGTREAEMAKLLENTYRHINIALVNELAQVCRELGIDIWDVIGCAATKPFGFQAFYPGPGVGGHCIPIDPNYLSYAVQARLGHPLRFVELAQEVNSGMPGYVARRVQDLLNKHGLSVSRARVGLVGVTYKADIDDQRESPANAVADRLRELGAQLVYHDPYVEQWRPASGEVDRAASLAALASDVDVVVVLQHHARDDLQVLLDRTVPVLDTRGRLVSTNVERL